MHDAVPDRMQTGSKVLWQMMKHLVERGGMILRFDLMFCSSTRSNN